MRIATSAMVIAASRTRRPHPRREERSNSATELEVGQFISVSVCTGSNLPTAIEDIRAPESLLSLVGVTPVPV
jgi:hypothetical protein